MLRVLVLIVPLVLLFSTLAVFAEESPAQAPPKQHKQVSVAPKTLDRYVGTYTVPGAVMKVTREATRLFIQENGKPRKELFAENEVQFYTKSSDDMIIFQGISHEKAIIMMIHVDGKDIAAPRIQ